MSTQTTTARPTRTRWSDLDATLTGIDALLAASTAATTDAMRVLDGTDAAGLVLRDRRVRIQERAARDEIRRLARSDRPVPAP